MQYGTPDAHRFICGWIEWDVKFINGELSDITLVKHDIPYKRTDEELKNYLEEIKQTRKEIDDKLRKNRLERSTPEQKLIDMIDEIVQRDHKILEIEDYYTDLREIKEKIDEYRTKHDRWYGKAPEQD
jgi:DNA repair exonuclease SbcCD ATPase subunit